jgi:tRNA (cmo5U34)-methyltransferase
MAQETQEYNVHDWQSPAYAAEWVADAEARDHQRTEQLALLAAMIPRPRDAAIRVLDVGAGYGVVTGAVLAAFPAAQVTLLDFSDAMLDQARARLAAHAAQLSYALGDFSRPGWEPPDGGPYDAIVSASALHNLRDGQRIAAIFRECVPLLAPGGAFLNLDNVSSAGPRTETQYEAIRDRPRRASDGIHAPAPAVLGGADAQAAAHSPAEPAGGHAHGPADGPRWRRFASTLAENLDALRAAGFAEVDCYAKWLHRALYGGYLP